MQVKKFEARTMKEALEMVKKHLGPEAIILGARDNRKSFGLVGEGSVEITAAISDEVLQRKKYTESKMRPQDRERFQTSPAKVQKQVMEKFVNKYLDENKPKAPPTKTRYIEINDQQEEGMPVHGARAPAEVFDLDGFAGASKSSTSNNAQSLKARIDAALNSQAPDNTRTSGKQAEISALRSELAGLKQALAQFQKVPQNVVHGHPGSDYGLSYEFSNTFEKLTQAGLLPEIAAEILGIAQAQMPPVRFKNKALVDAWTARYLLDHTQIVGDRAVAKVQVFVGPAGTGKTSAMVKLAAHAAVKENKKVVLLTTDTYKVGAADQMRTYAQILNVPFAIVRKQSDWTYLMNQLAIYDLILCDFPGMSLKSVEEITLLRNLLPADSIGADIHLVLPATSKNEDLFEIGRRFKVTHFKDVIFTGLDQSTQHGNIYNFMKHFNVPLHSFGIGTRVPEDIEMATRERVLDLIFKLTRIKKAEDEA
ncbi:MAG: flagellar biosynthesis protein FlhF [Bdellovibrio sp.]|jgi:flagellar biosynthesis protein FlhF